MLYDMLAVSGQRAARYWDFLLSGSGASNGSPESVHGSNSTSTKTTSLPALSSRLSGSPTSVEAASSPQCRAVEAIAAESLLLSDFFEAASSEFKTFALPAVGELTDAHSESAPEHSLTGFKGDAIVLIVKDRYGAPQSVVVPEEGFVWLPTRWTF